MPIGGPNSTPIDINRGIEPLETMLAAGNVHYWEIIDKDGKVVDRIHDMATDQQLHLKLKPGETRTEKDVPVRVHGKKFTQGGPYKLKYRVWVVETQSNVNLKIIE